MAVALPDVCVSLISDDGRSDGERYKKWCEDNLKGDGFSYVTPDDLYSMRCGVLHNGRFGDLKHSVKRVVFVPPNLAQIQFTNCKADDVYLYSVVTFCENITKAAYQWYESNRHEATVTANSTRLMQYRNDFDLVGGVWVIA